MSSEVVKSVISDGFCKFNDMENVQFLQSGQDNSLTINSEQTLNGDAVFELAGQGSLYLLLEEPAEV